MTRERASQVEREGEERVFKKWRQLYYNGRINFKKKNQIFEYNDI